MKKSNFVILSIFFVYAVVSGCQGSKTDSEKRTLKGKYNFTLSDTLNMMLAEGTAEILKHENKIISGNYKVTAMYAEDPYGLSNLDKEGNFEGQADESSGKLFINMNPKLADNNVFLNLEWKKDTLAGTWTHSTMTGVKAKGNFRAVKVKK